MLVVLIFNLAPAFAPPTWTVLVFFSLNSQLPPWLIVIVGAVCAGFGRYNLARLTGLLRFRIKGKALKNLQSAQLVLEEKSSRKLVLLALFVISPLPSAQLFEAAGLPRRIARSDNRIIKQRGQFAHVKNGNVAGLFIFKRRDDGVT